MRFNSHLYLLFLALAVVVFWSLPRPARRWWLLAASYAFCASWGLGCVALLFAMATVNHLGVRWIAAAKDRGARLAVIVGIDLAVLIAFKYGPAVFAAQGVAIPAWAFPAGLSFYTFEAISYVTDVARRRAEPRPLSSAHLFLAFFPKMVAGPIVRAKELFSQLDRLDAEKALTAERVRRSLRSIVTGLVFKVVLADALATKVDVAFARDPTGLGTIDVWVMAIGFSLQLYFDFAGYSMIALGSAGLFGVDLVENFDHPYAATSLAEFWQRWHMSLGRWIRDYVHYPIARGAGTAGRAAVATMIAMIAFGAWHGASATFLLWGAFHGAALVTEQYFTRLFRRSGREPNPAWRVPRALFGWTITRVVMSSGALLFRARSLTQARVLVARAWDLWHWHPRALSTDLMLYALPLLAAATLAGVLRGWRPSFELELERLRGDDRISYALAAGEGMVLGLALLLALASLDSPLPFVYVQF